MKGPKSLSNLVERLQTLPGVGQKTAERLAFHILKAPLKEASSLASAIVELKEKITLCPVCYSFTESERCSICADPERDKSVICVVEEPSDVYLIERIGEFKGVYHVLLGTLAPLDGVGPEDIKIAELDSKVKAGGIKEVIVATNPTVEGEATAMYIAKTLKPSNVSVTRIARGLPMGGDLEYADEVTLSKALSGRSEM